MVEIQQRGIEFLRSVQKVGTSYRALGLAERSSNFVCIYIYVHIYTYIYIIRINVTIHGVGSDRDEAMLVGDR